MSETNSDNSNFVLMILQGIMKYIKKLSKYMREINEHAKEQNYNLLSEELKQYVMDNEIKLVVIDHLSKIFCGDENNRNQVNEFGNILYQFCRNTQAMIIVLAHTNKSDNQYSGSSANAGIYRMAFLLTYSKSNDERTLSLIKSNSTSHIKPIKFIIDDDLFCDAVSSKINVSNLVAGKLYTRDELCALAGEDMNTRTFARFAEVNNLIKEKNRKKINGVLKTVYTVKENK